MPTGYTADIAKGITFKQFALNCARAFGALISMRDENTDVAIPDAIEPDDYHKNAVEKANKELIQFNKLTEKQILEKIENLYKSDVEYTNKKLAENQELLSKYEKMLKEARNYEPPSEDHVAYKNFMIQQIEDSIKWDCDVNYTEPKKLSVEEWKERELESIRYDIDYHTKEWAKEQKRAAERTKWIQQLKKSLD